MRRISAEYLYDGSSYEPLKNAYVEVADDGTVLAVGKVENPETEPEFHRGAIVPGFVNTHCHLELSYLKGKFRKGTGMAGQCPGAAENCG